MAEEKIITQVDIDGVKYQVRDESLKGIPEQLQNIDYINIDGEKYQIIKSDVNAVYQNIDTNYLNNRAVMNRRYLACFTSPLRIYDMIENKCVFSGDDPSSNNGTLASGSLPYYVCSNMFDDRLIAANYIPDDSSGTYKHLALLVMDPLTGKHSTYKNLGTSDQDPNLAIYCGCNDNKFWGCAFSKNDYDRYIFIHEGRYDTNDISWVSGSDGKTTINLPISVNCQLIGAARGKVYIVHGDITNSDVTSETNSLYLTIVDCETKNYETMLITNNSRPNNDFRPLWLDPDSGEIAFSGYLRNSGSTGYQMVVYNTKQKELVLKRMLGEERDYILQYSCHLSDDVILGVNNGALGKVNFKTGEVIQIATGTIANSATNATPSYDIAKPKYYMNYKTFFVDYGGYSSRFILDVNSFDVERCRYYKTDQLRNNDGYPAYYENHNIVSLCGVFAEITHGFIGHGDAKTSVLQDVFGIKKVGG